jgi:hypothetical protein
VAKSVNTTKLVTSPAMMRTGFRPEAPPARSTGSTGSTHGEMAVISPATKPIPRRTSTRPRVAPRFCPDA